jgi:hypothetical protein
MDNAARTRRRVLDPSRPAAARPPLRDRVQAVVQAVVLAYESALVIPGTTRPDSPGHPL